MENLKLMLLTMLLPLMAMAQEVPQITTESEDLEGTVVGKYSSWTIYSDQHVIWSVEGSLPEGFSLSRNGGDYYYDNNSISGTPTTVGELTFTLRVTSSKGLSSTKTFTVNVSMPEGPQITTDSPLGGGIEGELYSQYLGATAHAQWSIVSGSLPPGLSLYDPNEIYGYPTTVGTYTFTLKATNAAGYDEKEFSITINANTLPPVITYNYPLPSGGVGSLYSGFIDSDRFSSYSINGDLPPGLSTANLGDRVAISGTPTAAGRFTFTIVVTNSAGNDSADATIMIYHTQASCTAEGKVWENNACWTKAEICTAKGRVWENEECRDKTPEEACTDFWVDNTCRTEAEICIEEGKVWERVGETTWQCREKTPEECTDEGRVWENEQCRAKTPEECTDEGNVWENEQCRAKTLEEVCTDEGNVWENKQCRAKTPEECTAEGNVWENEQCTPPPTTPIRVPQIAASQIRAQSIPNGIMLQNLPHNAKIEAYNLQGKRIYSSTSHSPLATSLNIPVQTKGIYFIKVSQGSQKQILRVPVR